MTETLERTPLWQMTEGQLRFIADDDLTQWDRRITAQMILRKRAEDENKEKASAAVDEDDGA